MADTRTTHTAPPVEGDGVSYRGIVWFVVILSLTTLVCQGLMWVLLKTMNHQRASENAAAPRAPLAAPIGERSAPEGRIYPEMVSMGQTSGPAPALLVREPVNLDKLHAQEHEMLTTYGYEDKNANTYRIPIERAKELVIERNVLPVRGQAPAAAPEKGKGK
jgi:hypothetical protein